MPGSVIYSINALGRRDWDLQSSYGGVPAGGRWLAAAPETFLFMCDRYDSVASAFRAHRIARFVLWPRFRSWSAHSALPIAGPTRGAGTFRYSKNRRYAGINRASRSLYSICQMLNTWLTNGDEALQRVWGLVSIDGVAEEWTA